MSETYKTITQLDKLIHQPARLAIMAVLFNCEAADFTFLLNTTGLTKGNVSSNLARLAEAGYVEIEKHFLGKIPNTLCRLTPAGRQAFTEYWTAWQQISRQLPGESQAATG
ncbi:MAG: transcriptional regulator [Anaerolineales bacterium]|nr:transcriptional regulator [Anaerolineales bacterium]